MKHQHNSLRIIGGKYRSRRLSFPELEGLRPTGNRIRETLFNWLTPFIHDAHCLDLFAGSGALGFEALSRGARHVTFVETSSTACDYLLENIHLLEVINARVLCSSAESALNQLQESFDIVFIDPPFNACLHTSLCNKLIASKILKPDSLIYLESPRQQAIDLPAHWALLKQKHSGNVSYQLYRAS